jgi:flagellar assembly protein FliH
MSSLPEQLAARPYTFDQVGAPPTTEVFVPAFELAVGSNLPDSLLAAARSEARAAGYASGWSQGVREAREQLAAEIEQAGRRSAEQQRERAVELARAIATLDEAAAQLRARTVPAVEQVEDVVIAIAVELAEALLGRELQAAPRRGLDALARALKLLPDEGPLVVELSAADEAVVARTSAFAELAAIRPVTLVASPQLVDGDAIVTCGPTRIDARVAPAVARVKEALGL